MKMLTLLEYDNGFVVPLKQAFIDSADAAYLKREVLHMIDKSNEEIKIRIVKIDRTMSLKEYKEKELKNDSED